jgi:hypothetical protein
MQSNFDQINIDHKRAPTVFVKLGITKSSDYQIQGAKLEQTILTKHNGTIKSVVKEYILFSSI